MKQISRFISTIFMPLFMPTYSVALLFIYTYFRYVYAGHFFAIVVPTMLFTFFIPGSLIYVMMRIGIISDLSLPLRSDRFAPYAVTVLSFAFLIYYFFRLGLPTWFLLMIGSSIVTMLIATVITLWWKISAHMFGVAGLIGGVMSVCYFIEKTNPTYLFMTLFIIAGMVGTSRIILKRHTPAQVYAGFVLGFTVSFIGVWLGS
jgi:membrane-associated phospholipid phosphatase